MIPVLLMIFGAILALLGLILLTALLLEPIFSTFRIVFQRSDDYVFYERGPGKKLLKKKRGELISAGWFMLIVGIVMFGSGYYVRFGIRGEGTLLTVKETYETYAGESGLVYDDGHYVASDGSVYTDVICICRDEIRYNGRLIGKIGDFEKFIVNKERGGKMIVLDDYATYKTYVKVLELLDKNAMTYKLDSDSDE